MELIAHWYNVIILMEIICVEEDKERETKLRIEMTMETREIHEAQALNMAKDWAKLEVTTQKTKHMGTFIGKRVSPMCTLQSPMFQSLNTPRQRSSIFVLTKAWHQHHKVSWAPFSSFNKFEYYIYQIRHSKTWP